MVVRVGCHHSYRRGRIRGWLDRPAPGTSDDCASPERPPSTLTSTLSNMGTEFWAEVYTKKSMERAAHILDLIDEKWPAGEVVR
jgi:hypothetical protein